MNHRRILLQMFLVTLMLLSTITILQPAQRVHAAGDLSIPPVPPPGIPLVSPGTTLEVNITVDSMDIFNSWDIAIWSNTTALNGTSIDLTTDTAFPGASLFPYEGCVNDAGSGCNNATYGGIDAMGIVQSQVVVIPAPTSPVSGVLFSIKYKAGAYTYTPLQFRLSRIINGGCQPCPDVQHTSEGGSYGTTSAPNISFTVSDQGPSVIDGGFVNTTLTVSSINGFTGQVNFAYHPDPLVKGIHVNFTTTSLFLNNSTASQNITISASPTTTNQQYPLNITATGGPRVFQDIIINLGVQEPGDFKVSINPTLIRVLPNSTTTAFVIVKSQPRREVSQEFSGNVTLSVFAKNATATLGQTTLYVGPGQSVYTSLSVWVPPSFYGFTYLINVTGVWAENHDLNDTTAQVTVTHVPSDLILTVSPDTLTVIAGHSAYGVLSITSANYFVGYAYPSSTLSGGTAKFNETTIRIDNAQTVYVSVNITIATPGHYTVLLTATGQLASGVAFARSAPENVIVQSDPNHHLVVQLPTKILGLPISVYFGILGGFAVIFVLLAALVYRKSKMDKDEWE